MNVELTRDGNTWKLPYSDMTLNFDFYNCKVEMKYERDEGYSVIQIIPKDGFYATFNGEETDIIKISFFDKECDENFFEALSNGTNPNEFGSGMFDYFEICEL